MTLNRFYRLFSRTHFLDQLFGDQPSEPHHMRRTDRRRLAEEEKLPDAIHAADVGVHFPLHRPRLVVLLRSKGACPAE